MLVGLLSNKLIGYKFKMNMLNTFIKPMHREGIKFVLIFSVASLISEKNKERVFEIIL